MSKVLRDTFNRHHNYLRISITERCNLRCTYCMPPQGVSLTPASQTLTTDEIIRLAKLFVSLGVDKIRLTGGEPTVRKDIVPLVAELNKIQSLKKICITSNGLALGRKLPDLFANGLTNLNLSLDTLIDGKFVLITRRNGLTNVLKSLHKAISLGVPVIKINVVIMKDLNDDEILNFVQLTKDLPVEIRFIEYMPFGGNNWNPNKIISFNQMLEIISQSYALSPIKQIKGQTSKTFSIPDHKGTVGFITSMTQNFCSGCNRLRITNDGHLKNCLFGTDEVDLVSLMRRDMGDEELVNVIDECVTAKKKGHVGMDMLGEVRNRPMVLIGG